MHMHERNTGLPSGWINIREQTSSGSRWVCLRELIIGAAFSLCAPARLLADLVDYARPTCKHVLSSPANPGRNLVCEISFTHTGENRLLCCFFFVILMSNLMAFCFCLFWILCVFSWIYLFMQTFISMDLFVYVKFYLILQQGFQLDLYFCCFLFALFTKKFPQSSLRFRREFQVIEERKLAGTRV